MDVTLRHLDPHLRASIAERHADGDRNRLVRDLRAGRRREAQSIVAALVRRVREAWTVRPDGQVCCA